MLPVPSPNAKTTTAPAGGLMRVMFNVANWFALAIAMTLALAAAALPLFGTTGELLNYGIASSAIIVGLSAVMFSFAARRSLLETSVATVFLAAAGLLFAINVPVAVNRSSTAAVTLARAEAKEDEVEKTRAKGEAAEASAIEKLRKAEAAELKAEEAPRKAAELLEEVKAEQAKLEKRRGLLTEETAALTAEKVKIREAKEKLDELSREVEATKKATADLAKRGEEDKVRAKEMLEKAEQKDREAQEFNKKVKEAIDDVRGKVKAKSPEDRREAIAVLGRLRDLVAGTDYDLCDAIVSDPVPQLRRAALDALEKVQPKLHPLVVTLALPPEGNSADGYCRAIRDLPRFGRAGLPLIAYQLQVLNSDIEKLDAARSLLLQAHADALSKIAPDDENAMKLLLTLPESPLATRSAKSSLVIEAEALTGLRLYVAQLLQAMGKEKPHTRKTAVPFFVSMLRSMDKRERQQGTNALATFGPDAESALPFLKKMNLDPSEQVRNAAGAAIAAIEGKSK
jgi:hypothetical protein